MSDYWKHGAWKVDLTFGLAMVVILFGIPLLAGWLQ